MKVVDCPSTARRTRALLVRSCAADYLAEHDAERYITVGVVTGYLCAAGTTALVVDCGGLGIRVNDADEAQRLLDALQSI